MVHNSFVDWVDAEVIPLQSKNPTWLRLDGQPGGGNRKVLGRFRHAARVWVVHGDTRIDRVMRAYSAIRSGNTANPFTIQQAKVRDCLDLLPKLKTPKQPKHFYVYG